MERIPTPSTHTLILYLSDPHDSTHTRFSFCMYLSMPISVQFLPTYCRLYLSIYFSCLSISVSLPLPTWTHPPVFFPLITGKAISFVN